jgi:AcrR family transcriptional regulator
MPRAFTDSERKRIREKLIEAGKRAINRLGIRLLAVDEIAREAGISKGSFYSFFPSREDFILSVFEAWEVQYRGALLREIEEGQGSPRERLERFFLGAFAILEREPGLAKMGFKEVESLLEGLPPERIAAHQAEDKRVLEQAFSRWAREGLLEPGLLEAFRGLVPALFAIAMHREDFPEGSYASATRIISEALALRLGEGKEIS